MSLSASMWTGVSGLLAHGEKMNVLGNNIANVNTVGFKASTMHFEDFYYQYTSTTAQANGQVGRGVSVAAVFGDFSQGGFETTNEATDLAIGGNGWFGVSPMGSEEMYYTRAGNFRFDKDGYLVDPHGYALQGWEIEDQPTQASTTTTRTDDPEFQSAIRGVGTPRDIKLEGFTCDPKHTENVTIINNLDSSEGLDNNINAANPFFALAESWNGQEDPPIGNSAYAYSTTIKVYDEGGTSHNLTVYFDQVADDTIQNGEGKTYWEYIVTIDPSEDNRIFSGGFDPSTDSNAGLLMTGTMTFNSAGEIEDMSAFTLSSDAPANVGVLDSTWHPTAISQNGYPLLAANFTGLSNASCVVQPDGSYQTPTPENMQGKMIEMNFGLSTTPSAAWQNSASPGAIGSDASNLPGFGTNATRSARATTSYDGSSSTLFMSQDGYTFGFLQNVNIDKDGILSGRYSNGVSLELYQVTLYDFLSETGLNREGGNLFTQTRESGEASAGPANNNGLGAIVSNALEQSNVDLAKEFVQMITTQRGFSANGKVITTTDQMLSEVIMLKR